MKLPCRHLLALGLTIDRDKEKTSQVQELGKCDNVISTFMGSLNMKRWRSPNAVGGSNDHFGGNELADGAIFEDTDLLAWNQSDGVDLEAPDAVTPLRTGAK